MSSEANVSPALRTALPLFLIVSCIIGAFWAVQGRPVPMPASPLAEGEKLYCVSYAPFRGTQTPHNRKTVVSVENIDEDLARLAKITNCVRTYATELGLDRVAEVARKHKLKVLQGIWIGREAVANYKEIERAVGVINANQDVIIGVVVGNEALLRGEISAADLAATIRGVKARIKAPVTYADVWEFWMRNRDLADAVDFVTIHVLPYWEDFPLNARKGALHIDEIRRKVAGAFAGKEILIGEAGWPSTGRMREGALPSPANQALHVHELLNFAKRNNYRVNVIEAFDQPWKRRQEGTVGGHWGFLDGESRQFKFAWGQPISNHPQWRLQAIGGVVMAALVFLGGVAGRRRREGWEGDASSVAWAAVGAIALASGMTIGWAAVTLVPESLVWTDWLRLGGLLAIAIALPVMAAAAIVAGRRLPLMSEIIGVGENEAVLDTTETLVGWLMIALVLVVSVIALGLVFDPRYRDFPFAALTGPAAAALILAIAGNRGPGGRGLAEKVFAAVFAASGIYIALNEQLINWQALWLSIDLVVLSLSLWAARGGRAQG